ncbi:hypothetical protein CFELI_03025 [Corynebacterium felinum]|nr:hypothetical protein CFELI_03025 [Corynebacterium felinum]
MFPQVLQPATSRKQCAHNPQENITLSKSASQRLCRSASAPGTHGDRVWKFFACSLVLKDWSAHHALPPYSTFASWQLGIHPPKRTKVELPNKGAPITEGCCTETQLNPKNSAREHPTLGSVGTDSTKHSACLKRTTHTGGALFLPYGFKVLNRRCVLSALQLSRLVLTALLLRSRLSLRTRFG